MNYRIQQYDDMSSVQSKFDKQDSLKREKAKKREDLCGFF
jgi:hypothetical protein